MNFYSLVRLGGRSGLIDVHVISMSCLVEKTFNNSRVNAHVVEFIGQWFDKDRTLAFSFAQNVAHLLTHILLLLFLLHVFFCQLLGFFLHVVSFDSDHCLFVLRLVPQATHLQLSRADFCRCWHDGHRTCWLRGHWTTCSCLGWVSQQGKTRQRGCGQTQRRTTVFFFVQRVAQLESVLIWHWAFRHTACLTITQIVLKCSDNTCIHVCEVCMYRSSNEIHVDSYSIPIIPFSHSWVQNVIWLIRVAMSNIRNDIKRQYGAHSGGTLSSFCIAFMVKYWWNILCIARPRYQPRGED